MRSFRLLAHGRENLSFMSTSQKSNWLRLFHRFVHTCIMHIAFRFDAIIKGRKTYAFSSSTGLRYHISRTSVWSFGSNAFCYWIGRCCSMTRKDIDLSCTFCSDYYSNSFVVGSFCLCWLSALHCNSQSLLHNIHLCGINAVFYSATYSFKIKLITNLI